MQSIHVWTMTIMDSVCDDCLFLGGSNHIAAYDLKSKLFIRHSFDFVRLTHLYVHVKPQTFESMNWLWNSKLNDNTYIWEFAVHSLHLT